MTETPTILKVSDLRTHFFTESGVARAVDGVSFSIPAGRTLGLVGESGCGKSVTALSLMQLVPHPPGRIVAGQIELAGTNLLECSESQMRRVRGGRMAMIFQEPMTSLNPVFTVGEQITEAIRLHQPGPKQSVREKAIRALDEVGIPAPEHRINDYPHQLSGGMRQRAMIAMALACKPELLIADEPTTALDVTIQAQILQVLKVLQDKEALTMLLITHDLGIVASAAQQVAVMYAGRIVEYAPVGPLYARPRHPYTQALFRSLPRLSQGDRAAGRKRLEVIPGSVPNPLVFPDGCRFHPRCTRAKLICKQQCPPLEGVDGDEAHLAACWFRETNE